MSEPLRMVGVRVEKTTLPFEKEYDYLVPEALRESLQRGCRVMVPFGRGNRTRQGMVVSVRELSDTERTAQGIKLKPVAAQLDDTPIFGEEQFAMADFLMEHTFCTFYDAVKVMLPPAVNVTEQASCHLRRSPTEEELAVLSEAQRRMLTLLQEAKHPVKVGELTAQVGSKGYAALQALAELGLVEKESLLRAKTGDKTARMVRLTEQGRTEDLPTLTPKQRQAVEFLQQMDTASPEELRYFADVGESVLKKLVEKGLVTFYRREILRRPVYQSKTASPDDIVLSAAQQEVFEGLWKLCSTDRPEAALLFGITGSGKTQIYSKLIARTLAQGKQAMLLVPEISLTPQMVQKLQGLFGSQVAVMHSSLSMGERLDEYKRIKRGQASVVVGTRSAVFAPCERLGLIILDEEDSSSYRSELSPRYHAREVAKLRCVRHGALLLLGSATPSVESYYRAKKGKYHLFTLRQRYADALLPEVTVLDRSREELVQQMHSISPLLQRELAENLRRGEQSILFLNRRGYHTVASCMECGAVVQCPHCDVALTFHKQQGKMMCHYCGHIEPFVRRCPSCGSVHLKLSGLGTQKLEDELQALLPEARILRMDADTTGSRYAYQEKWEAFGRGDYDVMVGTQMVAKGLNFPLVTLVGVLHADQGLYAPDFRGSERVFALITQVVGRSGRADKRGRAYIQTYQPEHSVILQGAKQDYPAFFDEELRMRKLICYPPFCDLCTLSFASATPEAGKKASTMMQAQMQKQAAKYQDKLALQVFGPMQAAVHKLKNEYRYKLVMKCKNNAAFRRYLRDCMLWLYGRPEGKNVRMWVDFYGE